MVRVWNEGKNVGHEDLEGQVLPDWALQLAGHGKK